MHSEHLFRRDINNRLCCAGEIIKFIHLKISFSIKNIRNCIFILRNSYLSWKSQQIFLKKKRHNCLMVAERCCHLRIVCQLKSASVFLRSEIIFRKFYFSQIFTLGWRNKRLHHIKGLWRYNCRIYITIVD